MADPPHEAGEPPRVEMFGVLELVLSSSNATGYKDVYMQKGRKRKPYQAKIYRPLRKDFINLGKFATAHEAAVAVAQARLDGIEDYPSPDKSRAESSALPRPALVFQCLLSLICCYMTLVRTEKRKLLAATPVNVPTPRTFQSFENRSVQLAVAQPQPWSAAASARAFAAGAVALAQPALAPLHQQLATPRALGQLPDGGRLVGR
jgi:hypothetical protein